MSGVQTAATAEGSMWGEVEGGAEGGGKGGGGGDDVTKEKEEEGGGGEGGGPQQAQDASTMLQCTLPSRVPSSRVPKGKPYPLREAPL